MFSKRLVSIIVFGTLLLGYSCSPALYVPSQADSLRTGITTDSLLLGRNLYINHCGSCHNLYLPQQFSGEYWKKEMPEMKVKAKVSENDIRLITNFILARSKSE